MIDSHLHVNYRGMAAGDIVRYMDKRGIDQCWLLTWEEVNPPHPFYLPLPVEDVFEAYRKYSDRIIPMYAPDPARPDAAERFMGWLDKGIRGCGELKSTVRWDDPGVGRLLESVNRLSLPLVFHMQEPRRFYAGTGAGLDFVISKLMNTRRFGGVTGRMIEAFSEDIFFPLKKKKLLMQRLFPGYLMDFAGLEARLGQYPEIKFVGHGPHFWQGFTFQDGEKEGIVWRLMESYHNIYADLSASGCYTLKKRPLLAKRLLDRFSGRILFGTDNFMNGLKRFLDSLNMGREIYRRIYWENAADLVAAGRGRALPEKTGRLEREIA